MSEQFDQSGSNSFGSLEDDLRIVLKRQSAADSRTSIASLIGRKLGQYTLVELLGEGGMAHVFRARQEKSDLQVAMKVLKPALRSSDDVITRFEREAASMRSIYHDHVVQIYDCPRDGDLIGIAMEYLPGGSLRTILQRGEEQNRRISIDAAVRFITQAAKGLGAAHEAGIVHRDVKPGNLLMGLDRTVKVGDFGVVLALENATWLTGLGHQVGTPAYMSPEQCRGERVTPASDVYSLGVTLFELITGRLPYQEESGSPFALMLKHINDPVPDPREYRRKLPNWLVWIILKCLNKNQDDRYPDGFALAEAMTTAPDEPDLTGQLEDDTDTRWRINTTAIREQLKRLPQRAIIAWACRCAWRVRHISDDPRIARCLELAEHAIHEPSEDGISIGQALVRVQKLRRASLLTHEGIEPGTSEAHALLAAASASACAAARCVDDAAADAAFVSQNAVTALELANREIGPFWRAAQRDFKRLASADLGSEGTIGKPIPKEFWND